MKTGTVRTSLVAVWAAAWLGAAGAPAADKPNFVFILTDDQRWDALGVVQREQGERARFPWFKTPNLDRLAAEGVRFRNAFVVNSLCAPSRATFLTGQYGHRNGIVNNHTPFPLDNVTHAGLLKRAGYATGYVGKWHMGSQPERPGFDFSASFTGQGVYFDCPILVNGERTPSKGWIDDVSTGYAEQFIRGHTNTPFLLCIGYKATHGPFTPPPRRAGDFENETARPVPNLGVPAIYRAGPGAMAPRRAGETNAVRTNLGYFRCLAAMDDNVGRVLNLLDELGLADRTMVVFAGDNGYYLGEHQLGDKRSAYDESLRIPLLLRYPPLGLKGRVIDQMALNVDLAPTFLDYAGAPVPGEMHGRSWRPLLEGRPDGWRTSYLYGYFYERGFTTPLTTAVRTETAKLIRYPGHDEWTEVFDLAKDPYELKNLARDPGAAELRKALEAEYERQAAVLGFSIPAFADSLTNGPPSPVSSPLNKWVLEYRFDRDDGDRVVDASGLDNHGTARAAPLARGHEGRRARRFGGEAHIDLPRTRSLNPALGPLVAEIVFNADKPDGVLFASGGRTLGYCLALQAGKAVLTVNARNGASRVEGAAVPTGEWVSVRAQIESGGGLAISVNGGHPARGRLKGRIDREPNDAAQIGADLRSPVMQPPQPPAFTGLIESVRIFSGEPGP